MTAASSPSVAGNAAIFYHPDGYVTTRDKLMGRHAAGEGFLRGFARHAQVDKLFAFAESEKHYQQFTSQVKPFAGGKPTAWVPVTQPERLVDAGTLYLPAPDLGQHVWQRRYRDPYAYSVTGVTHTICTDRVMDSLGNLLIAPVEEWDAVIFTSREVKTAAENMLAAYGDYLGDRLGANAVTPKLQMPVIPLGVDCDVLQGTEDNEAIRNKLRHRYQIGEQDIVVLFFGRLSYHAKAHPLPMYLALEAASKQTGSKIHLIQAGWFANESIKASFVDGAKRVCPSVRCLFVDGRLQETRDHIWRAADIFCSLSDNVQETFGLTPIEAMAAGLPVVVSDWDGYRDTMEPGPGGTGFTIPTTIPAAGCGADLAYRYYTGADTYDQYIGYSSQAIAVDVEATTAAFIELIGNPELRRRMGEKGKARARERYDWRVVIGQYEALWRELAERRAAARPDGGAVAPEYPVPLRADPFAIYPHYATRVMDAGARISVITGNPFKVLPMLGALRMNSFARGGTIAGDEDIKILVRRIRKTDGITLGELLADVPQANQPVMQRSIGWLAKLGIVKVTTE